LKFTLKRGGFWKMNLKRCRAVGFALLCVAFAFPQVGHAGTQTNITLSFGLSGTGSLLSSPAGFVGTITSGGMAGGYFTLYIDDTDWPTDAGERWDYIVSTFFSYTSDPGNEHWTGYFPVQGTLLPPVIWHFYDNGDNLGGIIRYLIITISDEDKDGVIDQAELMNQAVAGNVQSHIEQSTGIYAGMCGIGSMNGNLQDYDPTPNDVLTIPVGNLYLRDFNCALPTDNASWGVVKSLYAE
jgi:hypothetical protein